MGGDSGAAQPKVIDGRPGGLVWVRRRNGSWWPGRILGLEEFPEDFSPPHRGRTPIKLLGKEDASVDWYNIEKSRRVKAFRCGEYDSCIEKAKAATTNSSRKGVKYVRRDDAILHALELESARLGKDHPGLDSSLDMQVKELNVADESPDSLHQETEDADENLSISEDNSNSKNNLSQFNLSFDKKDIASAFEESGQASAQDRQQKIPNDSEDDAMEGNQRMRGLEDLGVVSFKRKRSQAAHAHDLSKKKYRRRPLAHVLENTEMVSVPILSKQLSSSGGSLSPEAPDVKLSGRESGESKKSFSTIVNNNIDGDGVLHHTNPFLNASQQFHDAFLVKCKQENQVSSMAGLHENDPSGRLFNEPFVWEEKHSTGLYQNKSSKSQNAQMDAGAQSHLGAEVDSTFIVKEDLNESGSASSGAANVSNIYLRLGKGASQWPVKGKRKARHMSRRQDSKRSMNVRRSSDVDLSGINQDESSLAPGLRVASNTVGGPLSSKAGSYQLKSGPLQAEDFRGLSSNVSREEPPQAKGTTAEMPPPQRVLPYRQSRFTVNPKYESSDFSSDFFPRHRAAGSTLYDVDVEVNSGYHPHHVPYVSLIGNMNGQAITGHSLEVEVLEDGFCDQLIGNYAIFESGHNLRKVKSSSQKVDPEVKAAYGRKKRAQNLIPQKQSWPTKLPKPRGRKRGSSKIRKLSSLTGSKKKSQQKKPAAKDLKGPTVACIPVKLVFSRLNAGLSAATRPAHLPSAPSNI